MRGFEGQQLVAAQLAADAITAFGGEHRFLSNYSAAPVAIFGTEVPTVEHAFAIAKCDPNAPGADRAAVMATIRRIAAAPTPGEAKRLDGRRGIVTLRAGWDEIKFDLVFRLLERKFAAPALRRQLLATGDRLLVEGNDWGDRIWGMVLDADSVWRGQNALGRMLMELREQLRRETPDEAQDETPGAAA